MSTFVIHPRLRDDCHVLGRLPFSMVLLQRNAQLPWFILVPKTDARELCRLPAPQREVLTAEIDLVSRFVLDHFRSDKLNVAAIGNLVSQLHVHVVGRKVGDACWPGVVWGGLTEFSAYSDVALTTLVEALSVLPGFTR